MEMPPACPGILTFPAELLPWKREVSPGQAGGIQSMVDGLACSDDRNDPAGKPRASAAFPDSLLLLVRHITVFKIADRPGGRFDQRGDAFVALALDSHRPFRLRADAEALGEFFADRARCFVKT